MGVGSTGTLNTLFWAWNTGSTIDFAELNEAFLWTPPGPIPPGPALNTYAIPKSSCESVNYFNVAYTIVPAGPPNINFINLTSSTTGPSGPRGPRI